MLFLVCLLKKRVPRLNKYCKIKDGVGVGAGASVSAENETPSGSNLRGTIIFINNINIFNSRGQFPSYLIHNIPLSNLEFRDYLIFVRISIIFQYFNN